MTKNIDNTQDVLDSRDVIERLAELSAEREALDDAEREATEALCSAREDGQSDEEVEPLAEAMRETTDALADWDDDNGDELKALKALAEDGESNAEDWPHGATLIRETYFVDYCRELVADIGDLPKDLPSYLVIDWEATAENLKADYAEVEFGAVAYLIR